MLSNSSPAVIFAEESEGRRTEWPKGCPVANRTPVRFSFISLRPLHGDNMSLDMLLVKGVLNEQLQYNPMPEERV